MKRRAQTSTERDLEGLAARKQRESAPEHIEEDITHKYSHDPALLQQKRRTGRTTEERVEHLELKLDDVQLRYDRLVSNVLASRTKIIVALVGAAGVAAGYLLGGCT